MSASTPDPRHRAVEVIERCLRDEDVYGAAQIARALLVRLEAAGLVIDDAPPLGPTGFCDFHQMPPPCHGCAGDAKAARDEDGAA